jgi:hypothetical protein
LDGLSVGFLAMSADTASEFIKRGFLGLNRQVEGSEGWIVNQSMHKPLFGKTCETASFLQMQRLRGAWPDDKSRGNSRRYTVVRRG